MCKGPYVILKGGSPIEKANNVSFICDYLEPRVFTKGWYKKLIFSKEKRAVTLYRSEKKIFLSIVERKIFSLLLREKFSRVSCFGSDKGAHTSSADLTWVITWKIIGDSLWSNKRGGDGSWSNKSGGGRLWSRSLNHFNGKSQIEFSRCDF